MFITPSIHHKKPRTISSVLALVMAIAAFAVVWIAGFDVSNGNGIVPPPGTGVNEWFAAVHRVAVAEIGEDPQLAPSAPAVTPRWCRPVEPADAAVFSEALGLMRATEDGRALFDLIINEGVCLASEQLPYNSGYSLVSWSPGNAWADSEIVIDSDAVDHLYPDILAAILVHEAEHLRRAVDGAACYVVDACTPLENGIDLEEEIAAHGAESRWWIAMYGEDGKSRALRSDHAENRLARAYLSGEQAFAQFVAEIRSDPREGDGI